MILPFILFILSAITHVSFFGWPKQVVFDEVYFASFVGDYSHGAYYFDIHPPLAKLITVFFGNIIGTTYGVDVSTIGNDMPWGIVMLRLVPIVCGIFLPIIIYFICRYLNFSKITAFSAGMFIILENSLLVQSRFLLFDSMMLLFGFTSILLYLIYIRKCGIDKKWRWLLVFSAVFAGAAFSIKWTGLAYPLLIAIAELARGKKLAHLCKLVALYAGIGFILYASAFAIHFKLLPHSGPGDPFMSDRFQKSLVGNPHATDATLKEKGFFGKFIELNLEMYEANHTLTATHPYSSPWYTWPVMARSVFYWQDKVDADGSNSYVYLLGNPLIYWLGTLAILFLIWQVIINKLRDGRALFIVGGFLVNFLPFALIGRVMFLYHYEAALIFSILAIFYYIETWVAPEKRRNILFSLVFVALVLFLFFAPLSYGIKLSDFALHTRMWLPTWR